MCIPVSNINKTRDRPKLLRIHGISVSGSEWKIFQTLNFESVNFRVSFDESTLDNFNLLEIK